jgi:WD40 repeat protein
MRGFVLLSCLCLAQAAVASPSKGPEPILRIETGRHASAIRHVSVDNAGKWLVTSSEDRTARIWEIATAKLVRTVRVHIGPGPLGTINTAAISPDGETVVVSATEDTGMLYVISRSTGKLLKVLPNWPEPALGLAYSHDGSRLAVTFPRGVLVFKTADWSTLFEDGSYTGPSFTADFDLKNRLVTGAWDGLVRLYAADGSGIASVTTPHGKLIQTVRFSGDGEHVAVGLGDVPRVDVLSGSDLQLLLGTNPKGVSGGDFHAVAWNTSGTHVTGAGTADVVRTWTLRGTPAADDAHPGTREPVLDLVALPDYEAKASNQPVRDPTKLPNGSRIYGAADGSWGILAPSGEVVRHLAPNTADFRGMNLRLSKDGTSARFAYGPQGRRLAAFSATGLTLEQGPASKIDWTPPVFSGPGLVLKPGTANAPLLMNGKALAVSPTEMLRADAVARDGAFCVLGSDLAVHAFGKDGNERWQTTVPAPVRAINISPDNRLAVVAYADGTIRWHRTGDGATLLTLFPHSNRKDWVAYTPSGYYATSPGGEKLVEFVENLPSDVLPTVTPASRYQARFHRPDVVTRVLTTLDEAKAVEAADQARKRPAHAKAARH